MVQMSRRPAGVCSIWSLSENRLGEGDSPIFLTGHRKIGTVPDGFRAAAEELKQLFGREVELIEKDAITNPFRRQLILRSHQVIYAA
jgi:hypothetical protein